MAHPSTIFALDSLLFSGSWKTNSCGSLCSPRRAFHNSIHILQGHHLWQVLKEQHCSVLRTPKACWSHLEMGMKTEILFLTQSAVMSFHLMALTSISLNIHMTAQAYDSAGLIVLLGPRQTRIHLMCSMSSSLNSGALLTGPLFLLSDLLQSAIALCSCWLTSQPASMCINFNSLMYWSPEVQPTAFIAAATFSTVSIFNGKGRHPCPHASMAIDNTCSLLVFWDALDESAIKSSLNSRLASANLSLPFSTSMTSSNEPLLAAPFFSSNSSGSLAASSASCTLGLTRFNSSK